MEEFEKLVAESFQAELIPAEGAAAEGDVEPAERAASDADAVIEVSESEKAG
jgi:hypothetical protein